MMNAIMAKEDAKQKEEEKKQKRDQRRAAQRALDRKGVEQLDIMGMARQELGEHADVHAENAMTEVADQREADDMVMEMEQRPEQQQMGEEEPKEGLLMGCLSWLMRPARVPPKVWETYRKEEIRQYIEDQRATVMGRLATDGMLYRQIKHRRRTYIGDKDKKGRFEGRGICIWPDPPRGGGESYFGLWREGQPNGHGVFRWYTGDLYMGQWFAGKLQGYGVYSYAPGGPYSGDSYEGTYFNGKRQGTGVYRYSGAQGSLGGIYLGEWMKGACSGNGVLTYVDGESYVGGWLDDRKHGLGVYTWGALAGEIAGDKFEGKFKHGLAEGYGRTSFNDGGWHKGRYENGKMNGFGVLLTTEGWEYMGKWKNDELHGRFVCQYSFGFGSEKMVQVYENGDFKGTRDYDPALDWAELESLALEAANAGEAIATEARDNIAQVTTIARRAKESQLLAQDHAEEGRYMLRASIKYKGYLTQWFGLRQYILPTDA